MKFVKNIPIFKTKHDKYKDTFKNLAYKLFFNYYYFFNL